ncbi:MAG: hypothetical protein AAFY36_13380 [Bacteroidota bacterium]
MTFGDQVCGIPRKSVANYIQDRGFTHSGNALDLRLPALRQQAGGSPNTERIGLRVDRGWYKIYNVFIKYLTYVTLRWSCYY